MNENETVLFHMAAIINGDGGCGRKQHKGGLTAQVDRLDLIVGALNSTEMRTT